MAVEVDVADLQRQIQELAAAMKAADPQLRRQMMREMKRVAEPIKSDQQSAVRGLSSSSSGSGGGFERATYAWLKSKAKTRAGRERAASRARGLRESAANATRIDTRATGRYVGVNIRTRAAAMPPDQRKLPRYMDKGSWRHPIYGTSTWVEQKTSPPGWFLETGRKAQPKAIRELEAVVQKFWAQWAARQQ